MSVGAIMPARELRNRERNGREIPIYPHCILTALLAPICHENPRLDKIILPHARTGAEGAKERKNRKRKYKRKRHPGKKAPERIAAPPFGAARRIARTRTRVYILKSFATLRLLGLLAFALFQLLILLQLLPAFGKKRKNI